MPPQLTENQITDKVIAAAIEVHRVLGPGLLESAYEEALCYELSQAGLSFERQKSLPVDYKEIKLSCGFRTDLIIEGKVILEIKAVEALGAVHTAQLLTYLKLSGLKVGLLINFNCLILKDGIKRVVNGFKEEKNP